MSRILVVPVDREGVAPRPITSRLRSQLIYFIGSPGSPQAPPLAESELWFDGEEIDRWIADGVFYLVSPLDTANMTEVELTEEQEEFLNWLKSTDVRHVRVVE